MKAFVIKNKDGGYSYAGGSFSKDLCISSCYETIEQCQKVIDYYDLKDCEVVEITIVEGNLEQENKILDEALNIACGYAMTDNELYDQVSDFNIENERYDDDHFGIEEIDVYDYFIEQAKENINND